ncbi:MAG: SCP2 sterol-binding domain-containing protein [Thermaerobacter sp.]|jgi:putative sterol carrier protein|nr:SCP2 sterol-binding domain-containing protein [Thermaerobacter sp.]
MVTHQDLVHSLRSFRENCNANLQLKAMNRDWNRVIHVRVTDFTSEHTIVMREGHMEVQEGAPECADMIVSGPGGVLVDVFGGGVSPTEPYLAGELQVRGSQEDILRLDFISLMIWGE